MDLHALPRRDLQALAKRNGVRANMSNVAMADALAALPKIDGIEEYVKEPVAEPTPAAEPEVQAAAEEKEAPEAEEQEQEATAQEEEEEREKQEISLPGGSSALKPKEVIMLDDSEEEEEDLMPDQDEEKALALAVGRRRAIRRARVEPVAAPATRKRGAAASKAEPAEAVPARTTRARSHRTVVSATEEEAPKTRRTSRRAAASKTAMQQEEEEKETQGDVSVMEADVPAPVSSEEGCDRAEEMEAPMDAQDKEQNEPVEEQSKEEERETETGDAAAEAVPARATRAQSKRTVEALAEDDAPKARRTSRRAAARKTSTELEEEEKGTQGDVSDVEAAVPALISSEEGGVGAEKMDAQNEEQNGPVEKQRQETEGEAEKGDEATEAVPARATRARRQRTVVSAAEEAPMVRRTSRRAVARKTSTEQEEEEKAAEGDVSEMEAAMPAPVSSNEGADGAEEMEAAMDAQNSEQFATAEADKGNAAEEAVLARPTRSRRQRTVVSAAEQEAPKARRTSRRAVARKTNTEREEEEERAQGDVFDVEAAVPAPSGDMEAAIDAQNEEQNELVGEQSPEDEGVVVDIPAPVEEEPPVAEDCMVVSSVEEQLVDVQQCEGSPAVLGLSEQEGGDGLLNDAVSSEGVHYASEDTEMVAINEVLQTPSVEATQEVDFTSNASEENEVPTCDEVLQSTEKASDEQEDMAVGVVTNNTDVSFEDMADHTSEENEDCKAEDETPVAEDSLVQEPLVHVQQCEEIHLAGEDTEMVPVDKVQQAMLESGEATDEVDCTSDAGEQNEDYTVEEEPPVADDVDSLVQEPLVDVLAGEDAETVPVNEVPQATTEEVDFTSNVGHVSEENEDCTVGEELSMAADVDSPVQGPLVAVQQCEATEEVHLVVEVAEMVPINEVPHAMMEASEATDEVVCTSDAGEENGVCKIEEEPTVADDVDSADDVADDVGEENGVQEPLVDVQQCEATEETHIATEDTEMVPVLESGEDTEEVDWASDVGYAGEEIEMPASDEMVQSAAKAIEESEASDEMVQTAAKAIEESEVPSSGEVLQTAATAVEENEDMAADEHVEDEAMVATDEMPQRSEAMGEGVVEVVTVDNLSQATLTDDEGGFTADITDLSVEEAMVATDEMPQRSEAMGEGVVEVVTVDNLSQATLTDDEGGFTADITDLSVEEEAAVTAVEMPLSLATMDEGANEEVEGGFSCDLADVTVEEKEEVAAMEENVDEGAIMEGGFSCDLSDVSVEEKEEVAAMEENVDEGAIMEGGFSCDLADVTVEEKEEVAAMEENVDEGAIMEGGFSCDLADVTVEEKEEVAAMEENVDEGAIMEGGFSCDLSDVSVEEKEVVAAMEENVEEVITVDDLSQATVDEGAVKDSGFTSELIDVPVEEEGVVVADEIPHSSATMDEDVGEVVAIHNLSQATSTDDEGAVKESVFSCGLSVLSVDEEGVISANEMQLSSATMNKSVEEADTVANLTQATVTDDEWAVKESAFSCGLSVLSVDEEGVISANEMQLSSATMNKSVEEADTVANLTQATVTDDEWAVKESAFSCGLSVLSVDEEGVISANEMQLSSATMNKSVEEADTVANLTQATVTDDEWAVKESTFAGDCTPVVDTATDFSDHIASPLSANVFEDATKSLSMDSITVEPMVSEPADVPLFTYSSSGGKKNASVPLPVQQEKELKVGNEPDALGSFSTRKLSAMGSISTRKFRIKLKEKVADGVPLYIFSSNGSEENSAEQVKEREEECNESEAPGSLSLRKFRFELNEKVAVTQENDGEKSSVPLDKLSLRKLRIKLRETLTAQKNMEPKRVPLGRLDENAC